jgi:hypothetical protein
MRGVEAARSRSAGHVIAVVLPAIVVIVAVLRPWTTHENRATDITTHYGAGAVGYVLVALALVAVCCALAGVWNRSATLSNIGVVSVVACLTTAIVLALTRISDANDAAASQVGGSRTSYEVGAVVGVVASAALVISCVAVRRTSRADARREVAPTP